MSNLQFRLGEKCNITQEIKSMTGYTDSDTKRIMNFKSTGSSDDKFVTTQIEKMTKAIDDRTIRIRELEERLVLLENGDLDDELSNIRKTNTVKIQKQNKQTMDEKMVLKEKDEHNKVRSKTFYDTQRQGDKLSKSWYYKSAERHFFKSCDSLPPYLSKELSRLPCNEGVVWRNVYFFGKRPRTSNTFRMVENQKGYKIIITWDKYNMKKVKKQNRGNKVEILEQSKRIIKS